MIVIPFSIHFCATSDFFVSSENIVPLNSGSIKKKSSSRRSSSSNVIGSLPGAVLSAPTSMISAPSSISAWILSRKSSREYSLPSEKELGARLRIQTMLDIFLEKFLFTRMAHMSDSFIQRYPDNCLITNRRMISTGLRPEKGNFFPACAIPECADFRSESTPIEPCLFTKLT